MRQNLRGKRVLDRRCKRQMGLLLYGIIDELPY